ncbi:cytochrome P450 1A1-like [Pholidichthys leucotaenia]
MALMVPPFTGALSVSEVLMVITAVVAICLFLKSLRKEIPEGLHQLPGPTPLPVIGNVLQVGSNPHLSLTEMSKKYGDVFKIKMGMQPVVVLSGHETVRQALITQGDEFAGRPDLHSFRFYNGGKSIAFSPDKTGVWRARRKLAYSALRSFSTVEATTPEYSCALEEHVSKEADCLIKEFNHVMKTEGSFDPFRYIVISVANVICGMCFGRRFKYNDQELVSIVNYNEEFGEVLNSGNLPDYIPILQYLPSNKMKKFVGFNDRFNKFAQRIVSEHYATFDKDNIRDITDSLINQCQHRKHDENVNDPLTDEKIVRIVNDLFVASTETLAAALSWSVMYCVIYSEIQERLYEEIRKNVGLDRTPVLSDRSNLPLLEAFILELFRHSSFMPFTIQHCTTKDTSLNGYFIPSDTCVFINQWQINHDPKLWKDPSSFNPDRFLSTDGTEINKTDGEKVMIFGLGKRRCIGEAISRQEVFLFLASMIQKLQFHTLPGETPGMSPRYGLSIRHKLCQLRATPRANNEK